MTVRWYSVVVDCHDVKAQAKWWGETLGWPVVFEADDEAVVAPAFTVDITAQSPARDKWPGLVFVSVPDGKSVKNRLHIDLAPGPDDSHEADVAELEARGARRIDIGQEDAPWVVLADPEGNEFCVLTPRP